MDDSSQLTRLQSDFLVAWFERSGDFFLTGGGALSGFYGLPRTIDWERFQVPGLEVRETARFFQGWLDRLTLRLLPDAHGNRTASGPGQRAKSQSGSGFL